MTLICQSHDPKMHEAAREMLAEGCAGCGHHGPSNALIDDGAACLVLCEGCVQAHGIELVDLQRRLLAVLVRDEWADAAIFRLSLAKAWNEGRVPMSRRRLFLEERWACA
jgi:hypothetical protein